MCHNKYKVKLYQRIFICHTEILNGCIIVTCMNPGKCIFIALKHLIQWTIANLVGKKNMLCSHWPAGPSTVHSPDGHVLPSCLDKLTS